MASEASSAAPSWFDGSDEEYAALARLMRQERHERACLRLGAGFLAVALIASTLLNHTLFQASLWLAGGFFVFLGSDRFSHHAARTRFFDRLCSSEREQAPLMDQPGEPIEPAERAAWRRLNKERLSWMRLPPSRIRASKPQARKQVDN